MYILNSINDFFLRQFFSSSNSMHGPFYPSLKLYLIVWIEIRIPIVRLHVDPKSTLSFTLLKLLFTSSCTHHLYSHFIHYGESKPNELRSCLSLFCSYIHDNKDKTVVNYPIYIIYDFFFKVKRELMVFLCPFSESF